MITYKETVTITHDDPHLNRYKKWCEERGFFVKCEDTTAITYEKVLAFKKELEK